MTQTSMTLPFNSHKLTHALALVDLYFRLVQDDLKVFQYEPIQSYYHGSKPLKYAPDAFIIWKGKPYIVEVQLTDYTRKKWAQKWANANRYFSTSYKYFEGASWNRYAGKPFIPHFIAVSNQPTDIVKEGFNVPNRDVLVLPY